MLTCSREVDVAARRARGRRVCAALATTLVLLLGLVLPESLAASPPWPGTEVRPGATTERVNTEIARRLEKRVRAWALGSKVSITVWDTATRSTLFQRHGARRMIGASNTKLLTGMLALKELGPNARIRTRVTRPGRRRVVIVGAGDQLLSSGQLSGLAHSTARALRRSNVNRVQVGLDDSLYRWTGAARGWHAGEVSSYGPGKVRSLVRDDIRASDASVEAAGFFTRRLRDAGIHARYGGRTRARHAKTIAVSRGHTVAEILQASLRPSDSDKAEALGRLTAVHRGKRATWKGGWAAQRAILRELGAPIRGVRLYDSSGLSHSNRITTNLMVYLMRTSVSPDERGMNALLRRGLLATSGLTGTLSQWAGRFVSGSNRCAVGRVHAKTGTLSDVVALSGFAEATDGRYKIFSVMVNNRPPGSLSAARKAIDDIAAAIVDCR